MRIKRTVAAGGAFTLVAVLAGAFVLTPTPARAAVTITVTTTADTDNATNNCLGLEPALSCSLREAIKAATHDGDTIQLQTGALYTLAAGELDHGDTSLTIQGAGATIDAHGSSRVLKQGTRGITIFDLTLTNGHDTSLLANSGGAIEAGGQLTLVGSTVTNSTIKSDTMDTHGGGVSAGGSLTLVDSQISGSSAEGGGGAGLAVAEGGCAYSEGPAFVQDSTLVGCSATSGGGGKGGALYGADSVSVAGSTIASSSAPTAGGGVYAAGSLEVTASRIMESTVAGGFGGGAFAGGTAMISSSTIDGNAAFNGGLGALGGGVYSFSSMTVTDSTFTGNAAGGGQTDSPAQGGGAFSNVDLTLSGSAFLANTASGSGSNSSAGGAAFAVGTATVTNTTFADNAAQTDDDVGGGSAGGALSAGSVTLRFSTFSGNAAAVGAQVHTTGTLASGASVFASPGGGGSDCATGATSSADHNFGDGSCGFTAAHDVADGSDPRLGAPGDHGGPTPTMLPQPGSPLIDAIPTPSCGGCAAIDQRGIARPQGAAYDIGAVEVVAAVTVNPRFTG